MRSSGSYDLVPWVSTVTDGLRADQKEAESKYSARRLCDGHSCWVRMCAQLIAAACSLAPPALSALLRECIPTQDNTPAIL
jgi:hypothetical protein